SSIPRPRDRSSSRSVPKTATPCCVCATPGRASRPSSSRGSSMFSPEGQATPASPKPGLGLGLSVVRDLIVKHGGTVTATSAGVGQGSEFVIRLPLDRSQELPSSAAESAPVAERSILVVEDNPDAAEALRMVLELEGHRVTIARDGRQAIEQTRSDPPNVALVH